CRSPERDRIREALAAAGIGNATYYTTPLHLQPALRFLGYEPGSLPETERAGGENFSVPLWPGIPAAAQEQGVGVVRSGGGTGAGACRRDRLRASPPPPAGGRRRDRRALVVPRVPAPFRPGPAAVLRHAPPPDDPPRRRDQGRRVPRLRLPSPLVAL